MRLEPVYLLAPKPKPPAIPTRRAFLIAGGTFFAGIGLGGACGYAAGVSGKGEAMADENALPEASGNAELDELRRLALKAPIEELMEKHMLFLDLLTAKYSTDPILWRGTRRICDEVLGNPRIPSRRSVAGWLATVIDKADPKMSGDLRARINDLRSIR